MNVDSFASATSAFAQTNKPTNLKPKKRNTNLKPKLEHKSKTKNQTKDKSIEIYL